MLFGKKKQKVQETFDKTGKYPVVHASICTGEKVAGFKSIADGKFEELMLIRNDSDLKEFMERYDVKADEIKREW